MFTNNEQMTKTVTVILFIVCIGLGWLFFNKPSGITQREIEMEAKYKAHEDSILAELDTVRSENIRWMEVVSKSERSAQRWENEAKTWKTRYNNEKNNNRHFTDASTDSLLSAIR